MNHEYLEVADRIAGRLCRDAIWSQGLCNWTADRTGPAGARHSALLPHLYSGSAGVALALWRIAQATGDRIQRFTARGAAARSLSLLPVHRNGFYTGCLGIRWAAAEILGELDESAILREAQPNAESLDIIAGSAGALAALLDLYRRTGRRCYQELAIRHGDLLLAEAIREGETWAWRTLEGMPPLTGFSHGAAGIGWSLLELWNATGEERFRQAALGAFAFERGCFDSGQRNWPDFRGEDPVYQSVWCHGAGGIAFSRLRAWQILADPMLLEEARIALDIVRGGFDRLTSFSLCHGTAGNADLMLFAAEILPGEPWQQAAELAAQAGLQRYHQPRAFWPSGMLRDRETPDLMWGTAGIAYFYLRLATGATFPTVLLPCASTLLAER
jgi:lantibiotic modifying enzyme